MIIGVSGYQPIRIPHVLTHTLTFSSEFPLKFYLNHIFSQFMIIIFTIHSISNTYHSQKKLIAQNLFQTCKLIL